MNEFNEHAKLHIFGREKVFDNLKLKSKFKLSKEDLENIRNKRKGVELSPMEQHIMDQYHLDRLFNMEDHGPSKR